MDTAIAFLGRLSPEQTRPELTIQCRNLLVNNLVHKLYIPTNKSIKIQFFRTDTF